MLAAKITRGPVRSAQRPARAWATPYTTKPTEAVRLTAARSHPNSVSHGLTRRPIVPRTPRATAWAKNSTPTTTHAYDGSRSRSSVTAAPPGRLCATLLGWKAPPARIPGDRVAAAGSGRAVTGPASPLSSNAMGSATRASLGSVLATTPSVAPAPG